MNNSIPFQGMDSHISVDIVIPQYRDTALLERCLTSLISSRLPHNIHNIWVVENGGIFGAERIVDELSNHYPINYLYQEQGNISRARNLGANRSTSDFIIFFDNDITFYPETISSYCKAFELYGSDYFYGGPIEPVYEVKPPEWMLRYLPNSAKGFSLGQETIIIDKPIFIGGNHGVYREAILGLGGYDDNSTTGDNSGLLGEETRLQAQLLNMGCSGVYVHKALVKHAVPQNKCNKRWALKRSFRWGMTEASQLNAYNPRRTLFRVPFFYYNRLVVKLISAICRPARGYWFRIGYLLSYFGGVYRYFRDDAR